MNYLGLKAGDRVWLGPYNLKIAIKAVHHTTATQVVIDLNGRGCLTRYKINGGWRIGGSFMSDHITGVATLKECQEWDARQAQERQEKEELNAEKERGEAKRQALDNLFGDYVSVCAEGWGADEERKGKWTVKFHNLTEEQVVALAIKAESKP